MPRLRITGPNSAPLLGVDMLPSFANSMTAAPGIKPGQKALEYPVFLVGFATDSIWESAYIL